MSIARKIGFELRDGHDIGRDPRRMTANELAALGHKRMSPLRALRLRCIDCSGNSAPEVRLCTAVTCPAWPFRMGANPWRAPASEAKRERARALLKERRLLARNLRQGRVRGETNDAPATSLPGDALANENPTLSGDGSEGRS
jgi:hypothetical protein